MIGRMVPASSSGQTFSFRPCAMLETWNTRAPMRRPAKPEDIADLVAALIANDYVTGEIVIADGGLNLT